MADDKEKKRGLDDHGIFLFSKEVDEDSCGDAIKFILEKNLASDDQLKYLHLIINSPGGYCKDGYALIDIMAGSKLPVRTTGIGIVASMGLMIFIAGQKGKRVLTPNTMILSHQWAGFSYGKEHELVAAQNHNKYLSEMCLRHYEKHTGLSRKKIRKYLLPPSDVWLSAREARKLGLCDIVKDL